MPIDFKITAADDIAHVDLAGLHPVGNFVRLQMRQIPDLEVRLWKSMSKVCLAEVKRYWPVDTGRSRLGLNTRVHGLNIFWWNKYGYAYWVEKKWFPLKDFFTRSRLEKLVQKAWRRTF